MKRKLNTEEAAVYLRDDMGTPFSAGTLRVWRSIGKGPRFCRLNRKVFYSVSDLEDYAKSEAEIIEPKNSKSVGR